MQCFMGGGGGRFPPPPSQTFGKKYDMSQQLEIANKVEIKAVFYDSVP